MIEIAVGILLALAALVGAAIALNLLASMFAPSGPNREPMPLGGRIYFGILYGSVALGIPIALANKYPRTMSVIGITLAFALGAWLHRKRKPQ